MNVRVKFLSFALLLLVMLSLAVIIYRVEAYRTQPALILLQSSERILKDQVGSLAATPYNEDIYAFRPDTMSVAVYDKDYKRSKDIISETIPEAVAAGVDGGVFLADTALNSIRVMNQSGRLVGEFYVPHPVSLAGLSSGNIVVASATDEKPLRVYKPDGTEVSEKFGSIRQFDFTNAAQNRFLNRGKVVVGPSDVMYFVPKHAPTPSIRKYSSTGQLLSEFVIEGAAINYQLQVANSFLSEKSPNTVGGFHIITSAVVDPVTGHLWIGMNGTSKSGVVYEYNADGEKLREYAFLISPPSGLREIITGVRDIVVKTPWIYVLTWEGEVYRFNFSTQGTRISEVHHDEGERKGLFGRGAAYLTSFTRMFSASATTVSTLPQLPCPAEQSKDCIVNCNPGAVPATKDCGAEIRMAQGDRVIGKTCIVPGTGTQPSCNLTVNLCNTNTGVRVTETVTLTCNAPGSGGGMACTTCFSDTECNSGQCPSGFQFFCDPFRGECQPWSPIAIDIEGSGFNLSDGAGGVAFDLVGNGNKWHIAWTSANSDDAWLALDRNGNGKIDSGIELFGNATPQPNPPPGKEKNGFLALAVFDKPANGGNNDGQIDNRDIVFSSLRLWQDINHNGISEPNELHTLPDLGIAILDLDYKESRRSDEHGNWFRYRAKVIDIRGAQVGRWAWDVFLVSQ